jgi:hypothetical protein
MFCCLSGETLCSEPELNKHVNGITISPKNNFCIIKIWLDTSNYQDPGIVSSILNLSKQGCIFKRHEPEF